MKCNKCGYEWTPRTIKPLTCPKCKRYDYDKVIINTSLGSVVIESTTEEVKEEVKEELK